MDFAMMDHALGGLMGQLGFSEMLMIFVIALLVFGPKKLPELGKSLGKGIREFKKATEELKSNWEDHVKDIAEPLNDMKRDIHSMGQSIKTDVYNHMEKAVEAPQSNEQSAPALTAAAAATSTNTESHEATTHPTDSNTPKEHV
jgi:TatA/E family protein of Tat protein translocase